MLIKATSQTTLGNVYILGNDDDILVGETVTIQCTYSDPVTHTGADAIITWSGTHTITVKGTIIGADEAINLAGCVTAQTVKIAATGRLFSGDGIVHDADGVILDGVGTVMKNAGEIHALGSAVSALVPDAGTMTISNSGVMYGEVSGIWHKFGNGVLNFTNSGRVESPVASFLGGMSTDNVRNAGQMIGLVDLGGGNDRYDGRGGSVTGSVLGGAGDDVFVAGNAVDVFDGGDGIDTLDLSLLKLAVRIDLTTPAMNSGTPVVGDSYTGIENFIFGTKADVMVGDGSANRIEGRDGSDTLNGGGGDDVLIGGLKADRLTGGAGADQFVFTALADRGDTITDFVLGEDVIVLAASAFGYGATTGALSADDFVSATSEWAAADATDHFIWRTTDATLWFDADGNGAGGPVYLCRLQAGATLTAAGIEFI